MARGGEMATENGVGGDGAKRWGTMLGRGVSGPAGGLAREEGKTEEERGS